MSTIEDANFETTVRQTIADMKAELNKVVQILRDGRGQLQPALDAEYQKICPRDRRNGKIAPDLRSILVNQ